jgi:hypothetical protein
MQARSKSLLEESTQDSVSLEQNQVEIQAGNVDPALENITKEVHNHDQYVISRPTSNTDRLQKGVNIDSRYEQ